MARKLNIGFNQGPATLIAQAIKYSLVRPGATLVKAGSAPTGRRYAPGHYVAIRPSQITASGLPNCGTVTGTYPNAVVTGAVISNAGPAVKSSADGTTGTLVTAGFVVRLNWRDVETTAGSFDYSLPDKFLAQGRAVGCPVFFLIITRTFDGNGTVGDGTNPLPADLRAPIPASIYGYANAFVTGVSGQQHSGFQGWRWSPTLRSRFNNFCIKMGARYNADPFFAGLGTQETSTGGVTGGAAGTYTVGGYTGTDQYTTAGFLTGLNDENDSISVQCPDAMALPYCNFMSSGGQTQLNQYAAHAQTNGSWFGCPDLVTGISGNSNIVNNVYPILQKFHLGTSPVLAPGPTFASVQSGEWNGTGVGDNPPNMANLFNFATASFSCKPANGFTGALDWSGSAGRTSPLKVDGIVWDYEPGPGTPNFTNDAVPIMKLFPTFGTWTPP